jgi:hypothetical protein
MVEARKAARPVSMADDDDEVLGEPTFEMLVRDGQPIIAGSYFMHPPLR